MEKGITYLGQDAHKATIKLRCCCLARRSQSSGNWRTSAREDAHEDLVRCRHRLSMMLLRRGWVWNGGKKAWGQGHRPWLRSLRLEQQSDQALVDEYLLAIEQVEQRLRGLEQHIETASQLPAYAEAVGALRCFRGIDTITAMGLVAELHDFVRFDSPRGLMAFLGLVPSEFSSADSERRGAITTAIPSLPVTLSRQACAP